MTVKTDRKGARGIAQLIRMGRFRGARKVDRSSRDSGAAGRASSFLGDLSTWNWVSARFCVALGWRLAQWRERISKRGSESWLRVRQHRCFRHDPLWRQSTEGYTRLCWQLCVTMRSVAGWWQC